jgi:hypothetical protein
VSARHARMARPPGRDQAQTHHAAILGAHFAGPLHTLLACSLSGDVQLRTVTHLSLQCRQHMRRAEWLPFAILLIATSAAVGAEPDQISGDDCFISLPA